jgi:hypothetical protein
MSDLDKLADEVRGVSPELKKLIRNLPRKGKK